MASERALHAAATRARGAEAAKAMALGNGSSGGALSASESVVSSMVGGWVGFRDDSVDLVVVVVVYEVLAKNDVSAFCGGGGFV